MAGTIFLFSTRPPASHLWPVETIQAFPQAQAASKPIPLACQPDQGPLFGALPPAPTSRKAASCGGSQSQRGLGPRQTCLWAR